MQSNKSEEWLKQFKFSPSKSDSEKTKNQNSNGALAQNSLSEKRLVWFSLFVNRIFNALSLKVLTSLNILTKIVAKNIKQPFLKQHTL